MESVLRLSRRYSSQRFERVCQIALDGRVRSPRYAHLQPILRIQRDFSSLTPPRSYTYATGINLYRKPFLASKEGKAESCYRDDSTRDTSRYACPL